MSQVIVYVEGGGDTRGQQAPLREGFHKLFRAVLRDVLGEAAPQPKIIACGGRQQAFEDFKQALKSNPGAYCILLVDGEEAVVAGRSKWEHVRQRQGDQWTRPAAAAEAQLHLMIQAMEAWLLADPEALATFYGEGFRAAALPTTQDLETVAKRDMNRALAKATEATKTGAYSKAHGFELIGKVDSRKVARRCPRAKDFFEALAERLQQR